MFFVVCVLLIIAGLVSYGVIAMPKDYWPTFVACLLGALLAVAELVARYRDDPAAAVLSWPAAVYVGVNATAAGVALYVIHVFGWTFGAAGPARETVQVLTAGLGSAALFRASLFNVTAGDRVIGIGPSEILNVIVTAADRAVDRRRALIRATRAAQIMRGLTFEGSAEALLAYCVETMQNVKPDEARVVEAKISTLRDHKNDRVHDTVKLYILGLALLSLVGDHVLEKASEQLRDIFNGPGTPPHTQHGSGPSPLPPTADKRAEVLRALRNQAGAMSLYELRGQVGLGLHESYIIEELRQQGLVTIRGGDGNETIEIAARGRNGHVPAASQHEAAETADAAAGLGTAYFAYGSNMSEEEIAKWCPGHRYVGVACLPGYRLAFTRKSKRGYGVADIIEAPGHEVWGVLYELGAGEMARLDQKEGLGHAYQHVDVRVRLEADGSERDAKAYSVITKETLDVPTSPEYLDRVVNAGYARGLPGQYLSGLRTVPTRAPRARGPAANDTQHVAPPARKAPVRRARGA